MPQLRWGEGGRGGGGEGHIACCFCFVNLCLFVHLLTLDCVKISQDEFELVRHCLSVSAPVPVHFTMYLTQDMLSVS